MPISGRSGKVSGRPLSVRRHFCDVYHISNQQTWIDKPRTRVGTVDVPEQTDIIVVDESLRRARHVIMQHGRNSTAYQILNPGIRRWLSQNSQALVGYVRGLSLRVVAGEPVCHTNDIPQVIAEFERTTTPSPTDICYFCASAEFHATIQGNPHYSSILIGAQPVWDPATWGQRINSHASLRAQLNRARNKGVTVLEWPAKRASQSDELHNCLAEWLENRPFAPLRFLVQPETLGRLFDRRIFVAERSSTPVGFVVASPIPLRNGWLIEQIIRRDNAPNGTAELMIDAAVRAMAREDYQYVTLGLAPLSTRSGIQAEHPFWLSFLFRWLHAHGRRFYNFEGLDFFKAKFRPDTWEPIYAITNRPRFTPRTLYAVAAAFTEGTPITATARGIRKALAQELRWLRQRFGKKMG